MDFRRETSSKKFQVRAISFGETAGIRFWGAAILAAAVLIFCGSARAQTMASDQSPNTFSADTLTNTSELIPPDDSGDGDADLPDAPSPAPPAFTSSPNQSAPYEPITGRGRLIWIVTTTLGPEHLAGGTLNSAYGTATNHPREDGTHWGGFGERFGIRLTGVATSNVMEASVGALWGEDPRYFRVPEESWGARAKNVIKMTFLARRADGNFAPAYARYIAYAGNNFLSNTWRADSEADAQHALIRTAEGFAGRMGANAWDEFWPTAKAYLFHRHNQQP